MSKRMPRPSSARMRLICAWCGTILRKGSRKADTSHGICPSCYTDLDLPE